MIVEWFEGLCDAVSTWSTLAIFLRLLLATIVGAIIGLDREYRNKSAGIKTHVLVCLGAALTMIVAEYVVQIYPDAKVDLTRMGAQVISGVGFLGVGTIIVTRKNEVRGLNTAAGLWACACIGLAAGIGFVEATLIAMLIVVLTFRSINGLDRWLHEHTKTFELFIELESNKAVKELIKTLRSQDCTYSEFALAKGATGSKGCAVTVMIKLPQMGGKQAFIDEMRLLDFVSFCEEI